MRIDENYEGEHKDRLIALLRDIEIINNKARNKIYIDKQDYHDEYSPERTEPCPDYFGLYSLKIENKPGEHLEYIPMDIDELDNTICAICEFCEFCI